MVVSASSYEVNDFEFVSAFQGKFRPQFLFDDDAIAFNRNALGRQSKGLEQVGDGGSGCDLLLLAVDTKLHGRRDIAGLTSLQPTGPLVLASLGFE
jgi:hypothetical protein